MQRLLLCFLAIIFLNLIITASVDEVAQAIRKQDLIFIVKTLSKKSYTASEKSKFLSLALEQTDNLKNTKFIKSNKAIARTLIGCLISTTCAIVIYRSINDLIFINANEIDNHPYTSDSLKKIVESFRRVNKYKMLPSASINLSFSCLGILFGLDQIKKGITMTDDKKSLEKAKAILSFLASISK